jgi:hypothetical protein
MISLFLVFSIVFISLLWVILLRRKAKKEIPLSRVDNAILIFTIIATVFVIFAWFGITPSSFTPYADAIKYGFTIIVIILVSSLIIHYRKKIKQSFAKKYAPIDHYINKYYYKRLLKEIGLELENEVKIKNIILVPTEKKDVLASLTAKVTEDIMIGHRLLPKYRVYPAPPMDKGYMKLGGIIFTITKDDAEVLAKKMTELFHDKKYRKRLYRYSSLFK